MTEADLEEERKDREMKAKKYLRAKKMLNVLQRNHLKDSEISSFDDGKSYKLSSSSSASSHR